MKTMLNEYDFACSCEACQEFEGLMPKAIEKIGGCGEGKGVSVYAQGEGVSALEVVDVEKLDEE